MEKHSTLGSNNKKWRKGKKVKRWQKRKKLWVFSV